MYSSIGNSGYNNTLATDLITTAKEIASLAISHSLQSTYIYDKQYIQTQCKQLLSLPHAYGLTVRYAMKANPLRALLQLIHQEGLAIDACSGYEAYRALAAGIPGSRIQITGQQWPDQLEDLHAQGVKFCACSLEQLERYGKIFPGSEVGIRLNPGIGSGQFAQVNVGGRQSSFGIWHEYIADIQQIAQTHSLHITTLHTHIGSGTDPEIRGSVAGISLEAVRSFPQVTHVNLGGGLKVARMPEEKQADIIRIGEKIKKQFEEFAQQTGRKLHLEIEPGTYVVANAGYLVSRVDDIVDTGEHGHRFIKLSVGMSEMIRPTMYGAQHPLYVHSNNTDQHNVLGAETIDSMVVGHSCESADIFTLHSDRTAQAIPLPAQIQRGDIVLIGGAGAYCSSMSTKHYNSYPSVAEYLRDGDQLHCIKHAEVLQDLWKDEVNYHS